MGNIADWQKVTTDPLGAGGQSTVYLVRRPERTAQRSQSLKVLQELSGQDLNEALSSAALDVARADGPNELGALKIFRPRTEGLEAQQQALERIRNEISILNGNRPGLLRLLDSNESESWFVTEYCAGGTLDRHLATYKGNTKLILRAFASLVRTVSELHRSSVVHRDIKPQNIFMGSSETEFLLGDFGIVFLPNLPERVTFMGESVGPRGFMPPWVLLDDHPEINATFDVYMLGKVLWCLASGRLKMHREDFLDPRLDVTRMFPDDPNIYIVNEILKKTVVTREQDCLRSAADLLLVVNTYLRLLEVGGQVWRDDVPKPCRVCAVGFYAQLMLPRGTTGEPWVGLSMAGMPVNLRLFTCDRCGHAQFFK